MRPSIDRRCSETLNERLSVLHLTEPVGMFDFKIGTIEFFPLANTTGKYLIFLYNTHCEIRFRSIYYVGTYTSLCRSELSQNDTGLRAVRKKKTKKKHRDLDEELF